MEPDVHSSYECSPWDQNCPSGEKCAAWANDGGNSWNAYRCVPVGSNPDGPGDACTVEESAVTGIDSCDAHSMCFDVDENLEGECHPYCVGSESNPQCNQPDHSCSIGGSGFAICIPICNPLLSDCESGEGCYPVDAAFVCAADASGPEGGEAGDPCEFINACGSGLLCANPDAAGGCPPGSSGCCTATCDVTADDCAAPQSCVSWWADFVPAPFGLENVGVCLESKP